MLAIALATVSAKSHERRSSNQFYRHRGWLFADTIAGAHASANLYSLVDSCKANGIEPYRYLVTLFQALPFAQTSEDYESLLDGEHELTRLAGSFHTFNGFRGLP